jgi:hypothetical protein
MQLQFCSMTEWLGTETPNNGIASMALRGIKVLNANHFTSLEAKDEANI